MTNKAAANMGLPIVGLDKLTSANCKAGLWFGLDKQRALPAQSPAR
jgi:hypothetical protein